VCVFKIAAIEHALGSAPSQTSNIGCKLDMAVCANKTWQGARSAPGTALHMQEPSTGAV